MFKVGGLAHAKKRLEEGQQLSAEAVSDKNEDFKALKEENPQLAEYFSLQHQLYMKRSALAQDPTNTSLQQDVNDLETRSADI